MQGSTSPMLHEQQLGVLGNWTFSRVYLRIIINLEEKVGMSSFLDRFVGRTQVVSKLGPEQLFKTSEEPIYTHTHKSFARSSTQQLRQSKQQLHEQLPPPQQE